MKIKVNLCVLRVVCHFSAWFLCLFAISLTPGIFKRLFEKKCWYKKGISLSLFLKKRPINFTEHLKIIYGVWMFSSNSFSYKMVSNIYSNCALLCDWMREGAGRGLGYKRLKFSIVLTLHSSPTSAPLFWSGFYGMILVLLSSVNFLLASDAKYRWILSFD